MTKRPEQIQTTRCTNTVARAFGIEATETLRYEHSLNNCLKDAGYRLEAVPTSKGYKTRTTNNWWGQDETKHDSYATIGQLVGKRTEWATWKPGMNLVMYSRGHVQAKMADGTIIDTYFKTQRGFKMRPVRSAYIVTKTA